MNGLWRNAVAAMLAMTTGCAMELGPTSESMHLLAKRYCPEPPAIVPVAVDRDVRGLFFSGDGVGHLWSYLFDFHWYDFIEWQVKKPRADGVRFLRYERVDWSAPYAAACPADAERVNMVPEGSFDGDRSGRACARIRPIAEPSARWHLHHTEVDRVDGPFDVRTSSLEIVDRRDGQAILHTRQVRVLSRNKTRHVLFLGPVPFYRGKDHAVGGCGSSVDAAALKRMLIPPVRRLRL